jgi:hypothetical protein
MDVVAFMNELSLYKPGTYADGMKAIMFVKDIEYSYSIIPLDGISFILAAASKET